MNKRKVRNPRNKGNNRHKSDDDANNYKKDQ